MVRLVVAAVNRGDCSTVVYLEAKRTGLVPATKDAGQEAIGTHRK